MSSAQNYRCFRVILPAGWVAVLSLLILVNPTWTALHFSDDSFFYLKTALNEAHGLGSTFDGINATNGYQFLWFQFLAMLFRALRWMAPIRQLQAVALSNTLLAGLAALIFLRLGEALELPPGLAATACMAALASFALDTFGMESSLEILLGLCLLGSCIAAARTASRDLRQRLVLGAVAFLLPLARTDSLTLCYALTGALLLTRLRDHKSWIDFGLILEPALWGTLAVLFLSAYNRLEFGHGMTVASYLKLYPNRAFPPQWFRRTGEFTRLRVLLLWAVSAAACLWGAATLATKTADAHGARSLRALLLLCLGGATWGYVSLLLFFDTGANFAWYYAWPSVAMVLCVAIMAGEMPTGRVGEIALVATVLGMLAFALAFASPAILSGRGDGSSEPSFIAAVAQHVAPGQRLFMIDQSGRTAFWSGRQVINGDGLVNGWSYQRALHDGSLKRFFARDRIDWVLADPLSSHVLGERVYITVPGWRGCYECGGRALGSAPIAASVYHQGGYFLIPASRLTFDGTVADHG